MARFLYEIYLYGERVGDSGNVTFSTEEDAVQDANESIIYNLVKLYNASKDDFSVKAHRARL